MAGIIGGRIWTARFCWSDELECSYILKDHAFSNHQRSANKDYGNDWDNDNGSYGTARKRRTRGAGAAADDSTTTTTSTSTSSKEAEI
jgi:hypothetical protein